MDTTTRLAIATLQGGHNTVEVYAAEAARVIARYGSRPDVQGLIARRLIIHREVAELVVELVESHPR